MERTETLLILFIKPIYKIYILCPLSVNDISGDEFLLRETQVLYQGVNMQCDTQGISCASHYLWHAVFSAASPSQQRIFSRFK